MTRADKADADITERAHAWRARIHDPDATAADRAALGAWLAEIRATAGPINARSKSGAGWAACGAKI